MTNAPKSQTDVILADQATHVGGQWAGSDINLMHEMWPDLDLIDFRVMLRVCMARGLNPLDKELYPVVYNMGKPRGGRNGRTLVLIESVDAMRRRAHSAGLVLDLDGPEFIGEEPDSEWTSVWRSSDPPFAARFGIQSSTMSQLRWATRLWSEATKRGQKGDEFWRETEKGGQPSHMLGLGAERQAWRRFCPGIFKAMYGAGVAAAPEGGRLSTAAAGVEEISWPPAAAIEEADVVADQDGVIEPDDTPDPESQGQDAPAQLDIGAVMTALWSRMQKAEPPVYWPALERIPGWPEGAERPKGIAALLVDATGTADELADMLLASLTALQD